MLEQQVDLWSVTDGAICITTNGTVKKNGRGVMGRGCALEAVDKYQDIDVELGNNIIKYGNIVTFLKNWDIQILSFPVKHNWWEIADIELIKRSCKQLVDLMQKFSITKVYLPRPGCGNGKLDWEKDVKPAIKDLLPDSVIIVSK